MKNHAFIMPVHNQPKLLGRIVRVLQNPNHYFFIHVNARVPNFEDYVDACAGLKNVVFIKNRVKVYHGGVSQVYATLEMLKAVSSFPVRIDYIHQISGQDYPLRSNDQFDLFFENTQDSFMCYTFEEDRNYQQEKNYINGWYPNTLDRSFWGRWYRKLRIGIILRYLIKRPDVPNLCGGWDWYSWSERVYKWVLQYLDENPQYLRRFNHTRGASEKIFATLLKPHLEELHIRKHYPLRYVSWLPHRPIETSKRPFNLTEEDYEFVLASPCFFCRKVHETESAKLLDMIDQQRGADFEISKYNNIY